MIRDRQERAPQDGGDQGPGFGPVTRVLRVDAQGHVIHDPADPAGGDKARAGDAMSLADLLPRSATGDLLSAIRAAAATGRSQFLEFDLLSPDGVRRVHAEASTHPDRQDEFVVVAREYSSREFIDVPAIAAGFAAFAADSTSLEAVFHRLAEVLGTLLTYHRLAIVTVHPERDEQHVVYATDPEQDAVIPLSGTAIEVVSRTNEPLVVPSAIPSVIATPLRWSGETIAYLGVHSRAWESYDDDDLRAVAALAPPVAAAMAAERHGHLARRFAADHETLRTIGAVIAQAGDLQTMVEVTADRISRLGRFPFVRVNARVSQPGTGSTAERGHASPGEAGDAALSAWPICPGAEPLGSIEVELPGNGGARDADFRFLSECASRLAAGINRLQSEDEVFRLRADLECAGELDRLTAGITDPAACAQAAVDELARLVGADSLRIDIGKRDTGPAEIVALSGGRAGEPGSPDGAQTAVIQLGGPHGTLGSMAATWDSETRARRGVQRLEAVAPRLAERLRTLIVEAGARAAARDAQCLAEIEAAVTRCGDARLALEEASAVLSDHFNAARVSVTRIDGDSLVELAVSGPGVEGWPTHGDRASDGTIELDALQARGAVHSTGGTPDELVARWPGEAAAVGAGMRGFAALALPAGGDVAACLVVRSPNPGCPVVGALGLLRQVAAVLAGPAIRTVSREAHADAATEWQALARIGQVAQASHGPDIPFARLTAELASVVGFDQVEVSALRPDGKAVRLYLGGAPVPGWTAGSEFAVPGTVFQSVLRTRRGIVDEGGHPSELARDYPSQAAVLAAGLRSFAAAPLMADDDPIGCLVLRSRSPGAYGARELSMVEAVAVHVSEAIARGRLRKELERGRKEREAVASIGFAASWELAPEAVAERAASAFKKLVPCDGVVVTAVSADADTVRVVFSTGIDEAQARFFAGRLDRLEEGRAIAGPGRFRSAIRARIGPSARPLGYLHALSTTADAFSEDDAGVLERMAEQLGSVFERARAADHSSRLSAEQVLRRRLDHQNRELKELTAARDRYLRTAVHELRTPLTAVLAFAETLLQSPRAQGDENGAAQLRRIVDGCEHMNGLIKNLLELSQLESDTLELNLDEFDAGPMLEQLAGSFGAVLGKRGQRLEMSVPETPVWLKADRTRVAAVISNLITNASKYSAEGSVIEVAAGRDGSRFELAVKDDGVGISSSDLGRLFTPFFRGTEPAVLGQQGTGLGLAIARSIVRLHRGDLVIESAPGRGTTARFWIEGAMDGPSEAYLARAAAERNGAAPA